MDEVRITIDGRKVNLEANVPKKELLSILEKSALQVKLSIENDVADEFSGTRWKVIDENSAFWHQNFTIQRVQKDYVYYRFDLDDAVYKCHIKDLTSFAMLVKE